MNLGNLPRDRGHRTFALPMLWAARNKLNVSGFVTYTDSETLKSNIHPAHAMRRYRSEFGVQTERFKDAKRQATRAEAKASA
ncbi:MAG TPA: hypothetical protein VFA77_07565 [Candidatus Eisenbacteria bacterium]|nr:hypothetical protein [Candidatus Eisenbacteria bacterium]